MTSPLRYRTFPEKFTPFFLALTLTLALHQPSFAVALGEATVHSALGQRLDADIEIAALSPLEAESLMVRLAAPDIFIKAGLDYTPALRTLRLSVEKRGEHPVIHLGSELAVSDPVLILLIEINANGNRTTRQYALLLDPPSVNEEPRSASVLPIVPAVPAASASPAASTTPQSGTAGNAPSTGGAAVAASPNAATGTAKPSRNRSGQAEPQLIKVRRGDTLAGIAKDLPESGASLDQVLIALLRANPQAFAANNIHRVKTGSVLRVPDQAAIRAVSPSEARREIVLQTADFHHYRSTLAAAAAPAGAGTAALPPSDREVTPANRSISGSVGVQQRDAGKVTEAKDQLRLSAAQDAAGKQPGDTNVLNQVASEKALADAKARIAELEKNVGDMQQQLALALMGAQVQQLRGQAEESKADVVGKLSKAMKDVTDARVASTKAIVEPPVDAVADVQPIAAASNAADRKSTRLNSSHVSESRMPSSA